MPEKEKYLRVHHLLCIPLFRGAGYSDGFSRNMTDKIAWLKSHPNENVQLVCEPDMICGRCPNCNPDQTCGSDGNHEAIKDRMLLPVLDLKEGELYQISRLFQRAEEKLNKESFDASCKNCDWYRQGYCDFEEYARSLKELNRKFFL